MGDSEWREVDDGRGSRYESSAKADANGCALRSHGSSRKLGVLGRGGCDASVRDSDLIVHHLLSRSGWPSVCVCL